MISPLQISSALAFTYAPVDLLALAGDAMSPLCGRDGRLLWQFTQNVTPEPPPGTGSFFNAVATYGTGAYDGGGTMQHWTATVRLIARATTFEQQGQVFSGYTLDFSTAQGDSKFEVIAMLTCLSLTRRLVERQWIGANQTAGFWRLINRGWSDFFIASASNEGGEYDLTLVLEKHGLFPYFDLHNLETVRQAMGETIRIRRLFDR